MATILFWAAGAVVTATFFVHVVLGGRLFIGPFLQNDIPESQKWMAYYAWHSASVLFVFMAAGFVTAALIPERSDYALIATALAASLVATAFFVCVRGDVALSSFPAIPLFSVVTALGVAGLLF